MRCKSCDKPLNNKEVSRKSILTGIYEDLCDPCFSDIEEDVLVTDNEDYVLEEDNDGEDHPV